jgi:hypothetical protein
MGKIAMRVLLVDETTTGKGYTKTDKEGYFLRLDSKK